MSERDHHPDAQRWNRRYRDGSGASEPLRVLTENRHLLPDRGEALDLACGRGANALLLADQGLQTHAWDISEVAIAALREEAERRGLSLETEVRDVITRAPEPERFDVIVVGHFLERDLAPALMAALRPGGLLFYQTFSRPSVDDSGPSNPAYRLAENELLKLFAPLRLRVYREEGVCGDTSRGFRNQAMYLGQKP
jgi:2-polyprenyl-3-methyl-5-hydroxy-6-metoxy-1,4-benzoquinol methylase